MVSFFSGWIGYGTGLQAGALQEPSDSAYGRRPIAFSALENRMAFDIGSGTVGPSSQAWGVLAVAGLFDAVSGGNLLVAFPLLLPVNVGIGATYTTAPRSNVFLGLGLQSGPGIQTFPAGVPIGQSPDGRQWISNLALQVNGGVLSAEVPSFGGTVTMGSLPALAPASGSGQLWNNGGIVAIA